MLFGMNAEKGIRLEGYKPVVVDLAAEGLSSADLWIHDEKDKLKASMLVNFFDDPAVKDHFPRPFGVIYSEDRFCYEDALAQQITDAIAQKGEGNLDKLLKGNNTWTIN
jgi:2-oxoglutarate ferredoxin oxidoreductase subunit beta